MIAKLSHDVIIVSEKFVAGGFLLPGHHRLAAGLPLFVRSRQRQRQRLQGTGGFETQIVSARPAVNSAPGSDALRLELQLSDGWWRR